MKRPKKCGSCRAIWQSHCHFSCALGYKIKIIKTGSVKGTDILCPCPDEECPKPLTIKELLNAPNAYQRRGRDAD